MGNGQDLISKAIASKTKWDQENRAFEEIRRDKNEILEMMKFETNPEQRLKYSQLLEQLNKRSEEMLKMISGKGSWGSGSWGAGSWGTGTVNGMGHSSNPPGTIGPSPLQREACGIIHSGFGKAFLDPKLSDEDKKEMLKAHGLWHHIIEKVF
jgi:hypothetical protein